MSKRSFAGDTVLVTGASRGIGRATAVEFAKRGAKVALTARNLEKLEEAAEAVRREGSDALVIPADMRDPGSAGEVVEGVLRQWGKIDILVSNAGEYIRAPVDQLTVEDIRRSMEINFYAGVNLALTALPHMIGRGNGRIVFVTSMDGKKGMPLDAPYAAAKFALTGFADVLRQDLYGTGVSVSNVLPGRVDTEMIGNLRVPWISAKIPPEAVARAIVGAALHRRAEVIIPAQSRLFYYMSVISPRLGDWAARSFHLEGWEELNRSREPKDSRFQPSQRE